MVLPKQLSVFSSARVPQVTEEGKDLIRQETFYKARENLQVFHNNYGSVEESADLSIGAPEGTLLCDPSLHGVLTEMVIAVTAGFLGYIELHDPIDVVE